MAGVYTLIKDHQIYDTTHKFHLNIKWEKSHRNFNSFNRDSFRKKVSFLFRCYFSHFEHWWYRVTNYCIVVHSKHVRHRNVVLVCTWLVVCFFVSFSTISFVSVCVCASALIFQWKLNISTPLLVAKWLVFDSVERLWIPCCACKTSKGLGYCDGGCKNLESAEVRALVKVPQIELRWLFCTNNSSCFSMRAYHMSAR